MNNLNRTIPVITLLLLSSTSQISFKANAVKKIPMHILLKNVAKNSIYSFATPSPDGSLTVKIKKTDSKMGRNNYIITNPNDTIVKKDKNNGYITEVLKNDITYCIASLKPNEYLEILSSTKDGKDKISKVQYTDGKLKYTTKKHTYTEGIVKKTYSLVMNNEKNPSLKISRSSNNGMNKTITVKNPLSSYTKSISTIDISNEGNKTFTFENDAIKIINTNYINNTAVHEKHDKKNDIKTSNFTFSDGSYKSVVKTPNYIETKKFNENNELTYHSVNTSHGTDEKFYENNSLVKQKLTTKLDDGTKIQSTITNDSSSTVSCNNDETITSSLTRIDDSSVIRNTFLNSSDTVKTEVLSLRNIN